MIKGIFSLRNFVAKQLTKSNPEGIMKLPNKGQIDFGEMMIREELFLRGIDHKLIKNEKQLETILNTPIPTPHTPKSADVLDLTGKKIDTDKPIVGGKNIDWEAVEKTDIEDFAQGGRTGLSYLLAEDTNERMPMWLGGGLTAGKRALSELLKYMSKGSSHGQTPSEMLKMINPKQFNEMLNRPEGIPSIAKEMIENYTKEMKIDRAGMVEHLIGTGRRIKKADDDIAKYKMKIIEDMMSKGTDRATAEQMAETILMMVKQGAGKKATPKITDQGLLEMENIQKNLATKDRPLNAEGGRISSKGAGPAILDITPDDLDYLSPEEITHLIKLIRAGEIPQYAGGGRVPFKLGGIDKMRRAFLKAAGAGAATVGAAKTGLFGLLKGSKSAAVKDLTQVPIGNPPGMPRWFKPLVNRVIREGEDVTKKFATKEREIVHQISIEGKIGKDAVGVDDIRVTQDLDTGNVRVQYNTTKSPGESGVDLNYKASEEIPLKGEKGSVKTTEEFSAVEAEPRYVGGPEDADIEWDGENIVSEVKDLMSDTSALKKFATGKPLSKKELAIAKQKQNQLKSLNESNVEQAEYLETKYGPGPDPSDLVDDYASRVDDYASGGRAGYVLGGKVGIKILNLLKDKKKVKEAYDNIFPTGDYKYDAEMVAESLVENNPKVFGNRLYEDLTDRERMEVYAAGLDEASTNFARQLKMKRAMKSMEETGTINISDDAVAEEFTNFMKETDPVGYSKIQKVVDDANQQLELKRFKTKGRKKNASGGLAKLLGE
jgi:hypothetical protein